MTKGSFTARELDIMSALWERGSGTVAEVRSQLPVRIGYTSVLKILQVLESNGCVRHETEGRKYRYFPTVFADAAGGNALSRVVDSIFRGSVELTLARLVSGRSFSRDELQRMRRIIDDLERESDK
jgi:BlaI family penicillinase repressor